jgi:prepilin-type N-terminal cleavage/methylation domain-containing protein
MLQFFWRRLRRDQRGFTLIELLIVVAIIAILAAILIPNFLRARLQARISATKGNIKNIATALESYFVDSDQYPGALGALAPTYIRSTPLEPGGAAYSYSTTGAPPTDYTLCDDDTDPNFDWYYTPGGGLQSQPAGACP